jgi:hypothetical protein
LEEGSSGGALGYLIVNLPIAIARILHKIITTATLGLQVRVVGTVAKTGKNAKVQPPKQNLIDNGGDLPGVKRPTH